jgi:hypothetical protein
MSSPSIDPAITRLLAAIGSGITASDSVAGLMLRLVHRVSVLERTVQTQAAALQKLARPAPLVADAAPPPPNGHGGPMGGPVRKPPERPPGCPPQGTMGRRDAYPHRTGPNKFINSYAIDSDFDDGP